jgi:dTDP-4-dehydrorhamnose reductase
MTSWFITGGRGQLGLDLQKLCDRESVPCVATDLPGLDISDLAAVRAAVRAAAPSILVNCAAYNAVDQAEKEPRAAIRGNAIGPRNLAIVAEELGIPLVHFGTDYVFDGRTEVPYTIADAPAPINAYGASKLLGETFVRTLCRRHYVVRLSWVFGAGNTNFPKKILEWSRGRDSLKVVTDQVSCPAYTVDVAECVRSLVDTGAYGLYHLANGGYCSRLEWARFIVQQAGLPVEIVPATEADFPTPARRPRFTALDPYPLAETIGREPPAWQDATSRFLAEIGVGR